MNGNDVLAFVALFGSGAWLVYLIFSVVSRKQQYAMQRHLLDKFSSTHDFTEFVQSPAGQKYVAGISDAVTAPSASILGSVRIGIIVIFVGAAFFAIRVTDMGALHVFQGVGTLLVMLGLGFLVSGLVSYLIAKKIKSEQAS